MNKFKWLDCAKDGSSNPRTETQPIVVAIVGFYCKLPISPVSYKITSTWMIREALKTMEKNGLRDGLTLQRDTSKGSPTAHHRIQRRKEKHKQAYLI
jgi:hypothetical protein